MRTRSLVACAVAFALLSPREARAALTQSEQAQIDGFVAGADVRNAAKVRSLVARPDLSIDESAASLTEALAPAAWTEAKAAFFRDMLFGGASTAARPTVAVASTRALLARAQAELSKVPTLDPHPDVQAELARIYGFLAGEIANAGRPRGAAHDPQAGIPASSYEACAKAIADHIRQNPRVFRPDSPLSQGPARLRAQLQLALLDMLEDTPTRRVDAADQMGLAGARRTFLTDLGLLVLDAGKADDSRVAKVRALVDRLPAVRVGVEAIYFGAAHPGLRARAPVVGVEVPLEISSPGPVAPGGSEEVEPGPLDLPLFALAYELSRVAAYGALDNRGELRLQAERDVSAGGKKPAPGMTTEQRLAGTMAQLVTDAPRTLDLAFVRFLSGRSETTALVSDALGALAAFAPSGSPAGGLALRLGRPRNGTGDTETVTATNVRLAPNGAVTSFALTGHTWEIHRDGAGVVDAVRRDGVALTLAMLEFARVPVTEGASWSSGGLVFARLAGSPRAGVAPGPRLRVVHGGVKGVEAVATPAPADDVMVDAEVLAQGGEAGLVVRALSAKDEFQGASVVLVPGTPTKASLRVSEGATEREVVPAVDLSTSGPQHMHIVVRGSAIEATVGATKLSGTLPASLAHGDVAVRVKRGASVDVSSLSIKPAPRR